ncbi:MAG: hypothetical protein WBE76_04550 [Terracidiphilus sp.]
MEAVPNWIDVRAAGKPDWTPDFYISDLGVIGQCKNYSKYRAIETLVTVSQENPYSASGEYLQSLFEMQANLLAAQKEADEQLRQFIAQLQSGLDSDTQLFFPVLPFEQLVEFFNQQPDGGYIEPVGMLRFLLDGECARNLLRRIYARIFKVLKAGGAVSPRFCGLSWSRRFWFLLHGSHLPKTERCPAFGCV